MLLLVVGCGVVGCCVCFFVVDDIADADDGVLAVVGIVMYVVVVVVCVVGVVVGL